MEAGPSTSDVSWVAGFPPRSAPHGPSRDRRQRHRSGRRVPPVCLRAGVAVWSSWFVKNPAGGVLIEVEGEPHSLDRFLAELTPRPPPLARIDELRWRRDRPRRSVVPDRAERVDATSPIFISPDVATCDDCLPELFDPRDRRYRYPFLNCTNCGPRLTIITGSPTTASGPPWRVRHVSRCRAEYDDPANRRFHAQPTACPACGPRLAFLDHRAERSRSPDPIARAAEAREGEIGAIKGLGGYHLACVAGGPKTAGGDGGDRIAQAEAPRRETVRDHGG